MTKSTKKILLFSACLLFVVLYSQNADANVFADLRGKTASFAKGLRNLAYAISGFGIIMFTFLAICGKINFKHLGYIFISLFMLSAVGAFIDYFTGGAGSLKTYFGTQYQNAACSSSLC